MRGLRALQKKIFHFEPRELPALRATRKGGSFLSIFT